MADKIFSSDKIRYWLAEIESSEKRKKKEFLVRNKYPDIIKYYEGTQYETDEPPRPGDTIKKMAIANEYYPNYNAIRSEVMYQYPDIVAEASKPDAEQNAPTMRAALKYGFKKLDGLTENSLALFDMIFAGFAAVEVGYKAPRPQAEEVPQEKGFLEKAGDFIKEKILNKPTETADEKVEKTIVSVDDLYKDTQNTFIRRWNPLNVGFDYRAERIKEIRFVYKILRYTPAELEKKYPKYSKKVQADDPVDYSQHENTRNSRTATLYEIQYITDEGKFATLVIAPSFPYEEIDYFERPYTTNGFDIKIEVLDEYGKLYPISRAKVNKSNQDDINNYLTHMMEVAERNIPKRGVNSRKVKPDAVAALNNNKVNQVVEVPDGNANDIWEITSTHVSIENKELLQLFMRSKEKLWSVPESRVTGKTEAEFAEEIKMQEAGYQGKMSDIQDALRRLIVKEIETLKDIQVQFWDGAHFFKITGSGVPTWYVPRIVPNPMGGMMVENSLTDILTLDYEIDVDILSAARPNKERRRRDLIEYLTWLADKMAPILTAQGLMINIDEIKKTAKDFGINDESLFVPIQPPALPGPEGMPPEATSEGVMTPEMMGIA